MKAFTASMLGLAALSGGITAGADYLELRRSAQLKETAESSAVVLDKLAPGTLLELTDDEQQNGYYLARTRNGRAGFVYRTLVRRHRGSLPAEADPAGAPPGGDDEPSQPVSLSGPQMRAHLINVGQGAATLFEFSCGVVLVDTGGETNGAFNSGAALSAYLDEFFDTRQDLERSIALLVLTHPHIDHARNVKAIADEYTVQNVVTSGLTGSAPEKFFSGGRQQQWLERWARQHARLETIDAQSVPKGGLTSLTIDPLHCTDQDQRSACSGARSRSAQTTGPRQLLPTRTTTASWFASTSANLPFSSAEISRKTRCPA